MAEELPLIRVLRWLLVLPAALAAGWFFQNLTSIGNAVSPRPFSPSLVPFVSEIIWGVAYVTAGANVAPSWHRIVAVCLAAVQVAFRAWLVLTGFVGVTWAAAISASLTAYVMWYVKAPTSGGGGKPS